jgi:hypothetical protein
LLGYKQLNLNSSGNESTPSISAVIETERHAETILKAQTVQPQIQSKKQNIMDPSVRYYHPTCPGHPAIKSAQIEYGYIPNGMRKASKVICSGGGNRSSIKIYPGQIIELTNVVLDFGKRSNAGSNFRYNSGFLLVDCHIPVNSDRSLLKGPIASAASFVNDLSFGRRIQQTATISQRDDCGNVWHALADFLRVFTSSYVADSSPLEQSVLVLDDRIQISDDLDSIDICLYQGSLQALGRKGPLRGVQFQNERVFFDRLIVPVEEQGELGLIWEMKACDIPEVLGRYVDNLFDYFGWSTVGQITKERRLHNTDVVQLLLSSRRKKPFANPGQEIGRRIANEQELAKKLGEIPGLQVKVAEFYEYSFKEQLEMFRNADIMLGMHGAGLTNLIYSNFLN